MITEILNNDERFDNKNGEVCRLSKETRDKTVFYKFISTEIF